MTDDEAEPMGSVVLEPASSALALSPATSARMSRQARRDTAPELLLRRALHGLGVRFRVDHPLPGMPRRRADLLLIRARIAVFVDGCFWHSCPVHATRPATNAAWWRAKLDRNVERDRDTDQRLEHLGWCVMRFWEHEDMDTAAALVSRQRRLRLDVRTRPSLTPQHRVQTVEQRIVGQGSRGAV
jgi:DNA mismatch endonuclease, patch repair protein